MSDDVYAYGIFSEGKEKHHVLERIQNIDEYLKMVQSLADMKK